MIKDVKVILADKTYSSNICSIYKIIEGSIFTSSTSTSRVRFPTTDVWTRVYSAIMVHNRFVAFNVA